MPSSRGCCGEGLELVGDVVERVELHHVPPGDGQTRATLGLMAREARAAAITPRLVAAATDAVRYADGTDPAALAGAVDAWVRDRFGFLPDPVMHGDWIRTPDKLLREISEYGIARGDCDDVATLVAALGMGVGLRARFSAVAFDTGGPYEHVFAELWTPPVWRAVDPARVGPLGQVDRVMILDI